MSFEYRLNSVLNNINESSLPKFWQKVQDHTCGVITAFRGTRSYSENMSHQRDLYRQLREFPQFSVVSMRGTYIENKGTDEAKHVDEHSFLVCNISQQGDDGGFLENILFDLASQPRGEIQPEQQDSILMIPAGGQDAYLVGTSHTSDFIPFGKKQIVGSGRFGRVAGEYLSKIKNRALAFEPKDPTPKIPEREELVRLAGKNIW